MNTMNLQKITGVLALGLMAAGCGQIKTIDRTQPNGLHKSQFTGLWYYRSTIIDSEPGGDFAVDGYASSTDKLRWDITEDYLIGYRSYEFVPYGEGLTDDGRDFFGAPVVAYAIQKHFDIQRSYNSATGVEDNVVIENDFDRPWHEREYMRVDWSQNVVGTPARFWTGWVNYPEAFFSGTALASHWIQSHEETNIDRPVFTEDYFDITNRYNIEPDPYYCYVNLLFNGVPTCGGQRVKVRLAFRKVDPTDDYQVLYYPDNVELKDDEGNAIVINFDGRQCDEQRNPGECRVATFPYFEAFGNIRTMRTAFDRERFLTRTGRIYVAGRFDLWEDSYSDMDGTLIPYANRTPKPIIYHLNADFPDQEHEDDVGMVVAANNLADMWADPFNETVAFLQGDIDENGRANVAAAKERWNAAFQEKYGTDFRMFITARNSCSVPNVRAYVTDPNKDDAIKEAYSEIINRVAGGLDELARGNIRETCSAIQFYELTELGYTMDKKKVTEDRPLAFQWERQGDTRFNFQNYVDQNMPQGPWGVVIPSRDPETGELVGTTGNIYAGANDAIAYREIDRLQWLNGELDDETLFRGSVTRDVVASRRPSNVSNIHPQTKDALMKHDGELVKNAQGTLFREMPIDAESNRFKRIFEGTDIERELLVTDDILKMFAGPTEYQPQNGALPTRDLPLMGGDDLFPGAITESAMAKASPVNWGTTLDDNSYFTAFRKMAGEGVEFMDFFDPTTSGLAESFRGQDRDTIYQWLRGALYTAVNGHEVGHAIGLSHNFGASMDPMNYKRDFWDLYWNNKATPDDKNRGEEYKYASIMDYGFSVSTEFLHGLGEYDAAAVRFMYGEIVDVWNPQKVSVPDPRKYASFARRCGHDFPSWGFGTMNRFLNYPSFPSLVSSEPSFDPQGNPVDSPIETLYRDFVGRLEANAAQDNDRSSCSLLISDLNWLINEVSNLPAKPENVYGGRMFATIGDRQDASGNNIRGLLTQEREIILNRPEFDDPSTPDNEAENGRDDDNDGVADDKGGINCQDTPRLDAGGNPILDTDGTPLRDIVADTCYSNVMHRVEYTFCPDQYAGFSPFCQPWDHGGNLNEQVDNLINRYERDYFFNSFRRDRFNWGSAWSYMWRLEARTMFHMTNVFRFYLYFRRSALDAPIVQQYASAAFKGVNFLEQIIQLPEPGQYCLNVAENTYEPKQGDGAPCNDEIELGLGHQQGKYYQNIWTDEYYYKPNRIGLFYDKLAAIRQMTTSSGRFIRDFSDLFDRRAFSLGYLRAWEDPIIQRFSSLIRNDHSGYQAAILRDADTNEPYVRYMPFFDEEDAETGASVQQMLDPMPKINPAWSWTLQYYALAYAISNFSSINDSSPEFYRFTKISIPGTPEDVEYPASMPLVEFTDPETRIRYRAPDIAAKPRATLFPITPRYNRPNSWGIGADLLKEANRILTEEYNPAKVECDTNGNCDAFNVAHRELREAVGFIDIMRRFNRQAEIPY